MTGGTMAATMEDQLAAWKVWLAEHKNDPEVIAGCERLKRILTTRS